ncbi:MAG TPA: hypothetical protein VMF57_00525 [Solirubrobacteraceae bacterium]|nr:hypothetical protein [Solirubrobacteraceae bacterium]
MSTADRPDQADLREHAEYNARFSASGIGAAVVRDEYREGHRAWECVVTDREEWHYIEVIGSDLTGFEELGSEQIERGIDRFAATLRSSYRMQALLSANPLHIDRSGQVTD